MPIRITNASPQPRIDIRTTDAETGTPRRVTRYVGVAQIEFVKEGRMAIRVGGDGEQLAMWIPDSLAYTAGQEVALTAIVTPSLQPISGGPTTFDGPYGVRSASAYLADDPARGSNKFISLTFLHLHVGLGAEVTYDVTAVTALT